MPNDPITGRGINTGRTRFKAGFIPWNKGKTGIYPQERLDQISKSTKARLRLFHHQKNKSRSSEERAKISKTLRLIERFGRNVGYPEGWMVITESVFKRDNYSCQECGIKLARVKGKGQVQCHHIDYDTSNNDLSNLITLCASCHAKTGFRREEWIIHYRSKIKRS